MKKQESLAKSFGHAFAGIWTCIKRERNMKLHLIAVVLVVAAGWWLRISTTEWLICLILFGMVLGAELINTAIEAVVDLSEKENNTAKLAKDAAAGAVLVCAVIAAISGFIIFLPKVITLFFG